MSKMWGWPFFRSSLICSSKAFNVAFFATKKRNVWKCFELLTDWSRGGRGSPDVLILQNFLSWILRFSIRIFSCKISGTSILETRFWLCSRSEMNFILDSKISAFPIVNWPQKKNFIYSPVKAQNHFMSTKWSLGLSLGKKSILHSF